MMNYKLAYKGTVYFYSEEEGKRLLLKKYNAGTLALAKLFANMLVGNNVSELIPKYINVYDNNGAPVLVLDSLITGKHVEDGVQDIYEDVPYQNYRAYFETTIAKTQIRASSAARARRVVLLDNRETELANIELPENEFLEVFENNDNLVIVWQMELIYDDIFEEVPDEYK